MDEESSSFILSLQKFVRLNRRYRVMFDHSSYLKKINYKLSLILFSNKNHNNI
jgi:hypothetical protein